MLLTALTMAAVKIQKYNKKERQEKVMKKRMLLAAGLIAAMLMTGCGSTKAPAAAESAETPAAEEETVSEPEETAEAEESTPAAGETAASELLAGKKVIYINSNVNDDWNVISTKYLEALVTGAGGECIIYNAEGDSAKQAQMVDDSISAKPDVLVVKPIDQAAIVPALQRLNEAGIPIITLDMGIFKDADVDILCAIQTNQESLGAINAQYIVDKAKETGVKAEIVTVLGDMSSDLAQMRQKGFNDVIEANSEYAEVLAETESKWDPSQAYTAVKDMMTAHPEANTVFSCADGMGIGALQALNDMGKQIPMGEEGHITFVSIDCDPNGCKGIEDGYIDQEAEHNAALHSDIAFKLIVDYVNGYELPENVFFQTTARNIDNVADAWGNLDVENVSNWGWMEQDAYVMQTPYTE